MLVIRDAQMAALKEARLATFHRRMVEEIEADTPAPSLATEDLARLVEAASAAALERGYAVEGDVRRFVRCAVQHGPSFPREPAWARAIDRHPGLTPAQKLAALEAGPPR